MSAVGGGAGFPPAGFVALKLAEAALRPSLLLVAGAVLGLALLAGRGRRARIGLALLTLCVGAEAAITVFPVDAWMLAPLEDRFPRLVAAPPDIAGVIVLGGALDTAMTAARGTVSLNGAAERMTEFVRLARRASPGEVLAFTGGSGRTFGDGPTEASAARTLFDGLGLAGRPIVFEDRSRTTRENAVLLARLVRPAPGQRFVLVTSAMHMPRAIGAFRAAGWDVIADPVAYKSGATWATRLGPDFAARLDRIDEAAHEWEGLAIDRITGRSRRLVPGPAG